MKYSILLVDDDPNLRDMLRAMLEIGGFDVIEAEDGLDALEKLEEITPDILVLDVMMPNLDGVSLCKQLRSDAEFVSLPIIMLSGKAHQEAIQEGLQAGANRYLVKPTGLDELTRNINEVLGETAVKKKIEA